MLMEQKRIYLTGILIFVFIFSFLQKVQGSPVSWSKGDKYTWEMYSGFYSYYENDTHTWDEDYSFIFNHKLESRILDINNLEKIVELEESWYFTPSSDNPFKVQDVEKSFDLNGEIVGKDITSLFYIHYEFDETENETYLSYFNRNTGAEQIPIRYFCTASWTITNNLFEALFSDSTIIDTVNGTEITFRDFLDNCTTYSIMGESDYEDGLNLMNSTNHHWSASFDYSDYYEVRGSDITSFNVEKANATFELKYSEGGVLERYFLRNEIDVRINNNYNYYQVSTRRYDLLTTRPIGNLLAIIIPTSLVGVIMIVVVILVVRTMKKRRV